MFIVTKKSQDKKNARQESPKSAEDVRNTILSIILEEIDEELRATVEGAVMGFKIIKDEIDSILEPGDSEPPRYLIQDTRYRYLRSGDSDDDPRLAFWVRLRVGVD